MFFFPEHWRACHLGVEDREDGSRVSAAKWRQSADYGNAPVIDVTQVDGGVDFQLSSEIVRREPLGRIRLKAPPEFVQILRSHCEASSVPVTAKLHEQLGHGFERFQQVELRDAAA